MSYVSSRDGTRIHYDRSGTGPALVLVRAGLSDGSAYQPHVRALADEFTVYTPDRRAHGRSGNTLPYALEREIEDLDAVVRVAASECPPDPPSLLGISSGGALVLEAAMAGVPAGRIAVYEVPYCVAGDTGQRWREYVDGLWTALAAGRVDDALELFVRFCGMSDEEVAAARRSPAWDGLAADAYKLAYDAAATRDGRPPVDRLAGVTQPTLVATGSVPGDRRTGMNRMPPDFYDRAAEAVAESIPHAERFVFDGGSHEPPPYPTAAVLRRFLRPGTG